MAAIPHIGFIVAAFAVAALAIAAMIAAVSLDYWSLTTRLAELERRRGEREGTP